MRFTIHLVISLHFIKIKVCFIKLEISFSFCSDILMCVKADLCILHNILDNLIKKVKLSHMNALVLIKFY